MHSNHKIVVFKMREILYTLLLLFLLIVLAICLIRMFTKSEQPSTNDKFLQSNIDSADDNSSLSNINSANGNSSLSNINSANDNSSLSNTGSANNNSLQSDTDSANDTSPQSDSDSADVYAPGIYTSSITLGDSTVDVEVSVDSDQIRAIRLVNLSESTAASFPLVSPSLQNIADQILASQSLEGIMCPQENKYTSQVLLSAIADALKLAKNNM